MHSESLPVEFIERLKRIVPSGQWQGVYRSFFVQKPAVLRINTLHARPEALMQALKQAGFAVKPVPWKDDALVVPPRQREAVLDSVWYKNGELYSQNLSSQTAPVVLDPQPGEEILDLCAAPGGKTLHIACMMNDTGRIAAVEKIKGRFFKLKANLKAQGVSCVQTYLADGAGVWRKTPERFDRVLLDAPCSSESRFRANDSATFSHWRPGKIKEMAKKQRALIHSAVQCLKPGGVMVYCTCSFAPEENEAIVDYALKRFADAIEIEPIRLPVDNTQRGLLTWKNKIFHPEMQHTLRILPDELMDGFFLSRIKKRRSTQP